MTDLEPKKVAILRILQILQNETDFEHILTHESISKRLESDYGIVLERKAIGRNIQILKDIGFEIETSNDGCYLSKRTFEDSELHLLIDSVLSSRHIPVKYSKDLINKLCSLSNKYFRKHIQNIYSVNEWNKSENANLFYNIELIDEAIATGKMIEYDYNKYKSDKTLHKTSFQRISPYLLILHNQRYYLMGYSSHWKHMCYHRLDRITNMVISKNTLTSITSIEGYESGINFKNLSSAMPYMYADNIEKVTFKTTEQMCDQIIDWFGKDILISKENNTDITITLSVSHTAMLYWALQYCNDIEIISPQSLRNDIKNELKKAYAKYEK